MGKFLDLDEAEYHADRSRLSNSVLTKVHQDPRAFGRWLDGKPGPARTQAMNLGTYVHALVLEGPEVAKRKVAFAPSRNEATNKDGEIQDPSPAGANKTMIRKAHVEKAQWSEFVMSAEGRTIVLPEQRSMAIAMASAVATHAEAGDLLDRISLEPEVSAHWDCPETGAQMRCRFDGLHRGHNLIVELKCVSDLDPMNGRVLMEWVRRGHPRQAAIYHDAYRTITGANASMAWIFVEMAEHDPKVCVMWVECDSPMVQLGRDGKDDIPGYISLIQRARSMRATGNFRHPWETKKNQTWTLPGWLERSMEITA